MSMQDRPARPGRTKPVPAADTGVDPIDYRPTAQESAPAPATVTSATVPDEGKGARSVPAAAPTPPASTSTAPAAIAPITRGREQTVQLSTRVSPDVTDIIDQAAATTGRSKRDLVEEAIRNAAWR